MNFGNDIVGTIKLVLVVLMFLGFIYVWIQISKSAKDKERVLQDGTRVQAKIVGVSDGRSRRGKDTEVVLTLEFTAPPWPTRQAKSSVYVGPVLLRDVVVGAHVHAIVDPKNPETVIVEIEKGIIR